MCTTNTEEQDRADMACLVGGHDAALNDLMNRHATGVFHFLYRMLGNEDDANDLAQETFVRVFQHRASFKPNAKFSTWLYTIAGNLARNHHRWRSRHPNVALETVSQEPNQSLGHRLPAVEATPSEAVMKEERSQAVRAAVAALPEDLREAIILAEWQDLSIAEAAAILKTTPKAVESRLYRARILLREKLRNWL
jgi:RNA polymerase sigma-70 factor, ECF subfamily